MAKCDVCGNDYDKSFELTASGARELLEQSSPHHPLLVGLVREEPADDVAGDEALRGVSLHVERGGAVVLDVGRGDVAQAPLPPLEILDAEVDPAGLRVRLD